MSVSQYCSMVLSRNLIDSPQYPCIPVQWGCRCICLWRPGARRPAWRGPSGELIVAAPLISPARKPCQTGREGRKEGREGGSPIKKCSRKRAAHCHWVHFVSLCSWHRNSSCGEAAAYPQALAMRCGTSGARQGAPLCRRNRSRRPS